MTDAELIESSLIDGARFALVFDRHYRTIHRFLRARVGPDLADDLASETFAIAFRRRIDYDTSRAEARPWIFGIAVNVLRDHRRAEERRLRAYARMPPDGAVLRSETGEPLDETVAAALLALDADERSLILLHAWGGLSYEQLAEALSLPLGTVRSRLSRTRAKLRTALTPEAAFAPETPR